MKPVSPEAALHKNPPLMDAGVRQTSTTADTISDASLDQNWKEAGRAAARVGNEVITLHDLVTTVKDQLKRHPAGRDLSKQELNMVAKSLLAGLIERSLIVQEAKRELKSPKKLDQINQAADKYWHDEELPPLMRQYMAENELQLKQKLAESGRSLQSIQQSFRQDFLAQAFVQNKVAEKQKVELPEMLKYYNDHYKDKENDRPALITWREVVVEKSKHPSPEAALQKANALAARLQRGENFATIARTESEGPSQVREQGGLMQTSPGSYAVESVNEALGSLPLNKVSPVLEGPSSLHIVRVEARRNAGPASFEEIQDQIRRKLVLEKMVKARTDFIGKLRRDAIVTTIFDGTESDPNEQ